MTAIDTALPPGPLEVPLQLRAGRSRADKIFLLILWLGALLRPRSSRRSPSTSSTSRGGRSGPVASTSRQAPTSPLPALHPHYGLLGELVGSLEVAVISLLIALPIGIACALLINEFVPNWARRPARRPIDLLSIVPGVIYGLWGLLFLSPHISGFASWLNHYASFVPLFRTPHVPIFDNSIFIVGVVIAIMVLPVITSVAREAMAQTPRDVCEAALALGGTRWGMITDVLLPFSTSGIVGGALLGFGRAMGETIAVLLILSADNTANFRILGPGGGTIPEIIGNYFVIGDYQERSALLAGALLLFAVTVALGIGARSLVVRS